MDAPVGTPRQILSLLRERRQQAQDLAETLGIDTSAVRRHLETLRAEGLVDAEDVVQGPGRPKKMYSLTSLGRETFPRDYALLVQLILDKLGSTHGRKDVERLVRGIAADVARGVAEMESGTARLDALLRLYNELGFEAEIERTRGGVVLVQRNCPFLKTAVADPDLMCRCLDEGIIARALRPDAVELECSQATGAAVCRHRITLAKGRAA